MKKAWEFLKNMKMSVCAFWVGGSLIVLASTVLGVSNLFAGNTVFGFVLLGYALTYLMLIVWDVLLISSRDLITSLTEKNQELANKYVEVVSENAQILEISAQLVDMLKESEGVEDGSSTEESD